LVAERVHDVRQRYGYSIATDCNSVTVEKWLPSSENDAATKAVSGAVNQQFWTEIDSRPAALDE
jgi:hypothetical protein